MYSIKLVVGVIVGIFAIHGRRTEAIDLSPTTACDFCKNLVFSIQQNADNSESISSEISDKFYQKVINSNMSPHDFCANLENMCGQDEDIETFGSPTECKKCQKIANNLIFHMHGPLGRHAVEERASEYGCAKMKTMEKIGCKFWLLKHKNALMDAILETHNNPHHACIIMRQC